MLITRMEQYNDGSPCEGFGQGFGRCGPEVSASRWVAQYRVTLLKTRPNRTWPLPIYRLCERHVADILTAQAGERAKRNREAITTT